MNELQGVRGIVWDFDGTLLDSFKILELVTAEVCREMNRPVPTTETFKRNFHGSLEDSLKQILDIQSDDELSQVLERYLFHQTKYYDDLSDSLHDDAIDLSDRAATFEIPQLVVTNREHKDRGSASPRSIVARSILKGRIDAVHSGDDPGSFRKPDPRSLGGWLEKHGLAGSNVLVIGDQIVDAQLGLALGARTVLVERNGPVHLIETLPDGWQNKVFIIRDLHEIRLASPSS